MIRATIREGSRPDRGFWFAQPLDPHDTPARYSRPRDVFLHHTVVRGLELEPGDLVDLEYVVEPDRRLRATYVERVEAQ